MDLTHATPEHAAGGFAGACHRRYARREVFQQRMGYEITDRRPIAARRLRLFQATARGLARAGVSANGISVLGMLLATMAAAALVGTRSIDGGWSRALWLLAGLGVQGRLLCNLLDGMVAAERGSASPLGELFNEAPDRYSDAVILVCLGYAAGGLPALGWAAALAAVLTAYVRALVCVIGLIAPRVAEGQRLAAWTAGIIAAGAAATAAQRLTGIVGRLRREGT
jgi:phosphatidylglycerophosphate synthase